LTVLQQQWRNASAGEKFVVLGAAVIVAAWLIGVVVNGIWWDVAGAQTQGLLAAMAAIVAAVVVYFNGASNGKLPARYESVLLTLAVVVVAFVALSAWSVFNLNSNMGNFSDCSKGATAACQKVASLSVNEQLGELRLTADNAGVGQKTVEAGSSALSGLAAYKTSKTVVPTMPVSTWVAAVGLIVGAALMAWGAFQHWTINRAATRAA
jgi:hypothetical protein